MELRKKELYRIIIASIIAGFVFSFDEWGIETFNLQIGITNLIISTIICLIIYLAHLFSQKLIAKKSDCTLEFGLVKIEKIPIINRKVSTWFSPIGPIITLLVTILSNGKLFFIALASFNLKVKRAYRVGHRWTNLKGIEEATIAAAGPISDIAMMVLFKLLTPLSQGFFSKAVFIASALAIFHMLPFPRFDGLKILVESKTLYLFISLIIILIIFFTLIINTLAALMLALILASIISFQYLYKSKS